MKLFIFLVAPFVALILFVQAVRFANTIRSDAVRWRGGSRSRKDSPITFWLLIGWNMAIIVAIVFIYGRMIVREFG